MSATNRRMDPPQLEQAVVDLLRLGLKGDRSSVRQLGRQLLTRPPNGLAATEAFREKVGALLAEASSGTPSIYRSGQAAPLPQDDESAMSLLSLESVVDAEAPLLSDDARKLIDRLERERSNMPRLITAGAVPPGRVLFVGPPGVGKTMAARHLAATLDKALVTLDLAAVMSSYLGRTGQNLRQVFDFAKTVDCVFFVDEFDAVAKRRDDEADIGELKRIVNLLLIELERWPSTNLLIAATNHPELLDRAIQRRFDLIVDLDLPDERLARQILERALVQYSADDLGSLLDFCSRVLVGYSGSDLKRFADTVIRTHILDGKDFADVLVRQAIDDLTKSSPSDHRVRVLIAGAASDRLGLSNRAIGQLLGMTHPTVAKLVDEWRSLPEARQGGSRRKKTHG